MGGQSHARAALPTEKRPGIHCTGGWVGHRACPEKSRKYPPTGIRSPGRPAPYTHTYTGPHIHTHTHTHIYILYTYIYYTPLYIQCSPVEIQTPARWTLIGRSITVQPPVLSPAVFFGHLRLIVLSVPQGNVSERV